MERVNKITSVFPILWLISLISLIIRKAMTDVSECGYAAICFPLHHLITMYVFSLMIMGIVAYLLSFIILLIKRNQVSVKHLLFFILPLLLMMLYYFMSNGRIFEYYMWGAEDNVPWIMERLAWYLMPDN